VKYLSTEKTFEVKGSETVHELTKKIEAEWGFAPCVQRLIYHMRQLDPQRTPDYYQIEPNAFLTLMLHMSGS
jgi:hypothetical protein